MAGRDYSIFHHTFWTGETGQLLRERGIETQIVAAYLFTCASANMIGLYYIPLPLLCHELGMSSQGASKALRRVYETKFAAYEEALEVVFVPQMAGIQLGETLSPKDNRHKAVVKLWYSMRKSIFYLDFHRRYGVAFQLPDPLEIKPLRSPSEGVARACALDQDQDQDQEQEQKKDSSEPLSAAAEPSPCLLEFPTHGKTKTWGLPQSMVASLAEAFPALDILAEARKARCWCIANEAKQKTPRGMPAFIHRWMDRAQNNAGRNGGPSAAATDPNLFKWDN